MSFRAVQPEVLCWWTENEATHPLDGIPLHRMPFDPIPENGPHRWKLRLRNLSNGNFYGAVGDELRALEQTARKARPELILCHYGTTALRMLPLARRCRLPLVAHFHGVDISQALRNRWYRWSLRRHVREFAALIVVAEYQKQQLLSLGADAARIHVIPCGVPVESIDPAHHLDRQPCHFLAVGRLVPKKGPLETLRAFHRCVEQVPDARLTVIGDGPLLEEARQFAGEIGIGGRVTFMGPQPSSVVMDEMRQSSVFVQHSRTSPSGDMEGWPVSVAEAMSSGLPVVATRHAGIQQQVQDCNSGYLVAEGDWAGMGERMAHLAQRPDLRVRMGRRSREIAEEGFEQRLLVQRLEQVLLDCVREARLAPPPRSRTRHVYEPAEGPSDSLPASARPR